MRMVSSEMYKSAVWLAGGLVTGQLVDWSVYLYGIPSEVWQTGWSDAWSAGWLDLL